MKKLNRYNIIRA